MWISPIETGLKRVKKRCKIRYIYSPLLRYAQKGVDFSLRFSDDSALDFQCLENPTCEHTLKVSTTDTKLIYLFFYLKPIL